MFCNFREAYMVSIALDTYPPCALSSTPVINPLIIRDAVGKIERANHI